MNAPVIFLRPFLPRIRSVGRYADLVKAHATKTSQHWTLLRYAEKPNNTGAVTNMPPDKPPSPSAPINAFRQASRSVTHRPVIQKAAQAIKAGIQALANFVFGGQSESPTYPKPSLGGYRRKEPEPV